MKRDESLDIAKGAAIVLVVYGHAFRGLDVAGLVAASSPLHLVDYIIYTFHMPLFFFASGLFFTRSIERGPRRFWLRQLMTIVYPYFLWSLLIGSVEAMLAHTDATNGSFAWDRLAEILWNPISPFWFLYALFLALGLAALTRPWPIEAIVLLALPVFIVSYGFLPFMVQSTAYAFLYVSAGIWASRLDLPRLLPGSAGAALVLSVLFGGAAVASWFAGVPERLPIAATVLGIAAVLSAGKAIEGSAAGRVLALVGKCSIGIYVMHLLAIGAVRLFMIRIAGIEDVPTLLVAETAFGVVLPMVFQLAVIRLGAAPFFGLSASGFTQERAAARAA